MERSFLKPTTSPSFFKWRFRTFIENRHFRMVWTQLRKPLFLSRFRSPDDCADYIRTVTVPTDQLIIFVYPYILAAIFLSIMFRIFLYHFFTFLILQVEQNNPPPEYPIFSGIAIFYIHYS